MRLAIGLAGRAEGCVAPNPSVGCVIVQNGAVVGRGWTGTGGRPHAETQALQCAGLAVRGATAYVSLEPCAHHGQTPPCADALVDAGIVRVVVGVTDPDPRVNGAGIRRLEAAGIKVETGVCAEEAARSVRPFVTRVRDRRPFVTVKTATTLDGRIATITGKSQWITGPEARAVVHGLRARTDAILVGGQTAIADDPALTCRLPGLDDRSPVRIILAGAEPLHRSLRVIATADKVPTWILLAQGPRAETGRIYRDAGARVLEVSPDADGRPDLPAAMGILAEEGITSLMVEGGGRVIAAFLRHELVDRIVWFRGFAGHRR